MTRMLLVAAVACHVSCSVLAADTQILTSSDPKLTWKSVALSDSGKTFAYTHGIGSAAYRHPTDPSNIIWTAGDRGPNLTCKDASKLISSEVGAACDKLKAGRVYPTPDYVPSIYKISLDVAVGTFTVLDVLPLKTKSGKPISGLLNPQTMATKDTGMDLQGHVLGDSADNVDLEGLVRLTDGSFWIGEEMGPSIAHVSADGRILKRLVPANAADDYKQSEADIVPSLPAILSKRQGNRGIESMAMSPDETFLYFVLQNPLANPNAKAYAKAKNTRLFKLERETGKLVGEYVYQLDDPQSFALDPSNKQNDPRVSELTAIGPDRLLVLERTDGTTKLHEISLEGATNVLGTKWDDVATSPSLEEENDTSKLGIVALRKVLRFDTARDLPTAPTKLEGVAILGDGSLAVLNDNDFGITGEATRIVVLKGAVSVDPAAYKR